MKKKYSSVKYLLIFSIPAVIIPLLTLVILVILLVLFLLPPTYTDIKDYQKCLDKVYHKEEIKHFPKMIPAGAKEVRMYCDPDEFMIDEGAIVLGYKINKSYIEEEFKKHKYLNQDVSVGTSQEIRYIPSEKIGINSHDLTYYVVKTPNNEWSFKKGFFPYFSGIGVSKDMDYILYYAINPD